MMEYNSETHEYTGEYENHAEIPLEHRRVILDETLSKRVAKVPIAECNEIIREHLEFQKSCLALMNYEIVVSDGRKFSFDWRYDLDDVLVQFDKIIGVYPNKRTDIIVCLKQANKIVKAYVKGMWYIPKPKDTLEIKPSSNRMSQAS